MACRFTMLLQMQTSPTDRSSASPHSGGWSESFWAAGSLVASNPDLGNLMRARRLLLPGEASVVGFRLSNYNIVGNRLIPTGSSTGKVQWPGNSSRSTDVPQMALECSGTAVGSANSSRFALRCVPDGQVTNGEYQPDSGYKTVVTQYLNLVVFQDWKFVGRDLTKPSIKVQSIAGNVVTLAAPIGAVAGTDFIRFRRVYDDDDKPITGAYLVTAAAGNTVTLGGFPARTLTTPSGTARIDAIVLCPFSAITPARIVVRKIGRPFESYRGRQSKKKV